MPEVAMTASEQQRLFFVVLDDGLGKWQKGDVIGSHTLLEKGCDIDRLLALRAMRAATEHESTLAHVDLASPEMHLSYEHMLADKEKQIARLTARIATLEEQISAGLYLQQAAPPDTGHHALLIEQKDRAIRDLEARLHNLQSHSDAQENELRTQRGKNRKKAAEAPAAEEPKAAVKAEAKAEARAAFTPSPAAAVKPPDAPPEPPPLIRSSTSAIRRVQSA